MVTKLKLIRHKIPSIHPNGQTRYALLHFGSPEHQRFLRKKLVEETEEYLEDRTVEELVDIIEVACATAYVCHGVDIEELQQIAERKRDKYGSIYEPVMIVIDDDN